MAKGQKGENGRRQMASRTSDECVTRLSLVPLAGLSRVSFYTVTHTAIQLVGIRGWVAI